LKKLGRRGSVFSTVLVAVALLALFGTGTAVASGLITSKQIKNNTIKGIDVKDGGLSGIDLLDGSVTGADILDSSVTGADLLDGGVTGADLANETVDGVDVKNDGITTADVRDDTLPGGGLTSADIAPLNGDLDIVDNTITTFDIATNAIDSDEVLDFGLSNEDVGVLFAQVNADGTIANSSGGVTGAHLGTGTYEVDFGRDISSCAYTATQGEAGIGAAGGGIVGVTDRSGNSEAAFVTMRDAANALTDRAFQLVVVC